MSQVKVPNEFFAKSKLEYSNWRWAFFRELIQNSYDAGATRIDFHIPDSADGTIIRCSDNGSGMSRNTIENVLLCLGGSKKADGSVGGFGYAKSLLFFAHDRYKIHTGYNIVTGSGGEYSIETSNRNVLGTDIEVFIDGTFSKLFINILLDYAKYLNVPRNLAISINGSKIETQFSDYEYRIPTVLGQFSFRETDNNQSVIVAVRGLPMFVHNVYSSGSGFTGLLELSGDTFDLLTANRDGLKYDPSNELTKIIQKITENRSVLKLGTPVVVRLNKTAAMSFTAPIQLQGTRAPETGISQIHDYINVDYPLNFNVRLHSVVGTARAKSAGTVSVSEVVSLLKKSWVRNLAYAWKSTVAKILDTEHFRVIVGVQAYHDGQPVPSTIEYCKYEADELEYYFNGCRISVGFVLAQGIEGLNSRTNSSGDIQILINPNLYDKHFLIGDITDLAIHECAHIRVSGHTESFVNEDMCIRRSLRRLSLNKTNKTVKNTSKSS